MPALETTAQNLPIGAAEAAGDEGFDAPFVWVTHVELDAPGLYSLLVEPEGKQIQAVGQIEVRSDTAVPAVGAQAIPSDKPDARGRIPRRDHDRDSSRSWTCSSTP